LQKAPPKSSISDDGSLEEIEMSIKRAFGVLAGVALLVMGVAAKAQAAPMVYFSPSPQTINISNINTVSFDILVSGLTEAIGGYDITFEWDDTILGNAFGSGDPDNNFNPIEDFIPVGGAGIQSLFLAGDPANNNDGTTDPLRIATASFPVLNIGTTQIRLTYAALSNADGTADIAGVTTQDALVCVVRLGTEGPTAPVLNDPGCTVPEPTMLSLLAAGLATAVVRRRASKRS
jgi:hypothetical protein